MNDKKCSKSLVLNSFFIIFLVSANVEGQPNGDTIPAEQAGPSEASGAAGSCQSDQIVQKIEEVLSGALGTELQCNPGNKTPSGKSLLGKKVVTVPEMESDL